jgi:hypothetical protein
MLELYSVHDNCMVLHGNLEDVQSEELLVS